LRKGSLFRHKQTEALLLYAARKEGLNSLLNSKAVVEGNTCWQFLHRLINTQHYSARTPEAIPESREFLLLKVYISADQKKELSLKAGRDFTQS